LGGGMKALLGARGGGARQNDEKREEERREGERKTKNEERKPDGGLRAGKWMGRFWVLLASLKTGSFL
jgi:hypothetical protein